MVVDPVKFRVIMDPWLHSEFGLTYTTWNPTSYTTWNPTLKKNWHLNLYIFIILLYFISLYQRLKPGLHICWALSFSVISPVLESSLKSITIFQIYLCWEVHVEVRGQLADLSSLLSCGVHRWDCSTQLQASTGTSEPSHQSGIS